MSKKLIQFGAGNIGRSFIGQVFSRSGFEVVFVDIAEPIVRGLNEKREYRVIVKRNNLPDETMLIRNVRAVNGRNVEEAAREAADASYIATSVGKQALVHIIPVIARGISMRFDKHPSLPVDIIIAENIRDGAAFFREELKQHLPEGFPLSSYVGLVETSIGKMVPIMREEDILTDPLWVFAEEYNSLIMDKNGFKNPIPDIAGAHPVDNINAYVDRKLFIHNLGHAAAAYLGYEKNQSWTYLWEPLLEREILEKVRYAMTQSAEALRREYPLDLLEKDLKDHIEDLLLRFQNKALGDTIFRVGRDLQRKLEKSDRLIGAMLLAVKHKTPLDGLLRVFEAALSFRAKDEQGNLFPGDKEFAEAWFPKGIREILTGVCKLDPETPEHEELTAILASQKGC